MLWLSSPAPLAGPQGPTYPPPAFRPTRVGATSSPTQSPTRVGETSSPTQSPIKFDNAPPPPTATESFVEDPSNAEDGLGGGAIAAILIVIVLTAVAAVFVKRRYHPSSRTKDKVAHISDEEKHAMAWRAPATFPPANDVDSTSGANVSRPAKSPGGRVGVARVGDTQTQPKPAGWRTYFPTAAWGQHDARDLTQHEPFRQHTAEVGFNSNREVGNMFDAQMVRM